MRVRRAEAGSAPEQAARSRSGTSRSARPRRGACATSTDGHQKRAVAAEVDRGVGRRVAGVGGDDPVARPGVGPGEHPLDPLRRRREDVPDAGEQRALPVVGAEEQRDAGACGRPRRRRAGARAAGRRRRPGRRRGCRGWSPPRRAGPARPPRRAPRRARRTAGPGRRGRGRPAGRVAAPCSRVRTSPGAGLCAIAAREQPRGRRGGEQRRHRVAAGRLAEDRHPRRVAAEGRDVVAHPLAARRPGHAGPGCCRRAGRACACAVRSRKPRAPSR